MNQKLQPDPKSQYLPNFTCSRAVALKTLTANAAVLCFNPQGKSKVTAAKKWEHFHFKTSLRLIEFCSN